MSCIHLILLSACISCKPFPTSKYLAVSLFSPPLCLCQTGRVPLQTRHWRCSSESAGSLRGESVFYPQQRVWITRARSGAAKLAAPQKIRQKSEPRAPTRRPTNNAKQHSSLGQTEKKNTSRFPGAQPESKRLCLISGGCCREARMKTLIS